MEQWRKDARQDAIIAGLDALVPQAHLLRKIEKGMDCEWLYERLKPYYCHDNGRPGTEPVALIKMVLIQRLFGIPSLRQTYREIQVNNAYRWFLGYSLLDEIPHIQDTKERKMAAVPRIINTPLRDTFICPHGEELRHTATDRDGERTCRSTPKNCVNCPSKACCDAAEQVVEVGEIAGYVFIPLLPDKLFTRLPQCCGAAMQTLGHRNASIAVPEFRNADYCCFFLHIDGLLNADDRAVRFNMPGFQCQKLLCSHVDI